MAVQLVQAQVAVTFDSSYLRVKRLLDVAFTLVLLVPFGLIMALVALSVMLTSEGPILYRQRRVGENGAEFEMLKFRSMYVNNDDETHRKAIERYMQGQTLNGDGSGSNAFKLGHDPRITPVGRFIRKTSLDELPQLFNVLRGEMTLVGPRPPLPYEIRLYSARDWLRLAAKPGLTGPWQVYGRSRVPFREMVEMDIAYLERQSLLEDIKLMALTVPVMVAARGGA
jgi:lipopolysaccharide/colanic/teichoic acid biosynthesis glycosyltransferase